MAATALPGMLAGTVSHMLPSMSQKRHDRQRAHELQAHRELFPTVGI